MMAYPTRPPPPVPAPPQTMGSTNIEFKTEMRFDPSYFKTHVGILRVILIIFNIIGIICISSSHFNSNPRGVFFIIIAILGMLYTASVIYAYVFHLVEKFHNWHWMKIEMFICIGLVFFNMISSTIAVAFGDAGFSAAGFFGYLCMVLYGLEAFLRARTIQSGAPAQGHVLHNKQAHAPAASASAPAPAPART